ncbi:MAG: hypothetical protein JWP87_5962 [Labilithrix sp.]|nr:hypothetical protein [Labilithrix sp.]
MLAGKARGQRARRARIGAVRRARARVAPRPSSAVASRVRPVACSPSLRSHVRSRSIRAPPMPSRRDPPSGPRTVSFIGSRIRRPPGVAPEAVFLVSRSRSRASRALRSHPRLLGGASPAGRLETRVGLPSPQHRPPRRAELCPRPPTSAPRSPLERAPHSTTLSARFNYVSQTWYLRFSRPIQTRFFPSGTGTLAQSGRAPGFYPEG